MYYAIMHDSGKCVATGYTYMECAENAEETGAWTIEPGTVAPYYCTNIEPLLCSVCHGNGSISDGYENWPCQHCEGTGYSMNVDNG